MFFTRKSRAIFGFPFAIEMIKGKEIQEKRREKIKGTKIRKKQEEKKIKIEKS